MALDFTFNGTTGPDETAISADDEGTDLPTNVFTGTGAEAVYDSARPPEGNSMGTRISAGVSGTANLRFDPSGWSTGATTKAVGVYVELDDKPNVNTRIIAFYSSTTFRCEVGIKPGAGTGFVVRLRDANLIERAVSSTEFSLDTEYRIETKMTGNASTGRMEAKIYNASGTLLETIGDQTTNRNTGGTFDNVRYGVMTNNGVTTGLFGGPVRAGDDYSDITPPYGTTIDSELADAGADAPPPGVEAGTPNEVTVAELADATAQLEPPEIDAEVQGFVWQEERSTTIDFDAELVTVGAGVI